MAAQTFLKTLEQFLDSGDYASIDPLIEDLVGTDFVEAQIRQTLKLLRKKRRFITLEKAAHIFIAHGFLQPFIRRQLAQGLIEQNRLNQAIAILQVVNGEIDSGDHEKPEILALLGRARKQLFVHSENPEFLHQAMAAYREGWEARRGDYRWHGINLAALHAKGVREKIVDTNGANDEYARDIARTILEEITAQQQLYQWDYGTAMEANLALGDHRQALHWARKYVRHPESDAFELGSSLRQLRQIWKGEPNHIVAQLEPVFEYEILQREGGTLQVTQNDIGDAGGFEAIYGRDSYVQIRWLQNMFSRLQSVGKVVNRNSGHPVGTGFLLRAADLNPDWGDGLVCVTNAHVVSDQPSDGAPLHPAMAAVEFTQQSGPPLVTFGEKLYYSPRHLLDTWICSIAPTEGLTPMELCPHHPVIGTDSQPPQRVYVVGHPLGGDLVISLYNNDLVGYEIPYVHYTSPTEGGSSGSPVLTSDLLTFALHHKARPALQVNQGVLLDEICQQTRRREEQ